MDVVHRILILVFYAAQIQTSRGQQPNHASGAYSIAVSANQPQPQAIVNPSGFNSYSQPRSSSGGTPNVNPNNYASSPDQRHSGTQGSPVYQPQNRQVPSSGGPYNTPTNEMQTQRPVQPVSGVVDFSKPNARLDYIIFVHGTNNVCDLQYTIDYLDVSAT